MPKKLPPEFKRDVVTVARRGDLTRAEVAADFDFDISVESVNRRMRQTYVDDPHSRTRSSTSTRTTPSSDIGDEGSRMIRSYGREP